MEPRAGLEGGQNPELLRQRIEVDTVQNHLGTSVAGAVWVVQSDRVADPGHQLVGREVATDQEDLGVAVTAEAANCFSSAPASPFGSLKMSSIGAAPSLVDPDSSRTQRCWRASSAGGERTGKNLAVADTRQSVEGAGRSPLVEHDLPRSAPLRDDHGDTRNEANGYQHHCSLPAQGAPHLLASFGATGGLHNRMADHEEDLIELSHRCVGTVGCRDVRLVAACHVHRDGWVPVDIQVTHDLMLVMTYSNL